VNVKKTHDLNQREKIAVAQMLAAQPQQTPQTIDALPGSALAQVRAANAAALQQEQHHGLDVDAQVRNGARELEAWDLTHTEQPTGHAGHFDLPAQVASWTAKLADASLTSDQREAVRSHLDRLEQMRPAWQIEHDLRCDCGAGR
jgi:hypothetical protein